MIDNGLATGDQAIFDLDFHAVMHWGNDPALEKHYVPTRSQRARSVLTFFAQDSGTHNLVYANADLIQSRPEPGSHRVRRPLERHHRQPTPTCLSWTRRSPPKQFSANSTDRGINFLTLRMRSPALIKQIHDAHNPPTSQRSPWTGPAPTTNRKSTNPPAST